MFNCGDYNGGPTIIEFIAQLKNKINEIIVKVNSLAVDVARAMLEPKNGKPNDVLTKTEGGYVWKTPTGGEGDVKLDGNNIFTGENEFVLPLKVADGTAVDEAVSGRQLDELADEVNSIAGRVTNNDSTIKEVKVSAAKNTEDISIINTVTIPNVSKDVSANAAEIKNLTETTLPGVAQEIETNRANIETINTTTIPQVMGKVNAVEAAASQTATNVQPILDTAAASAGDVLTLDDGKNITWAKGGGGGGGIPEVPPAPPYQNVPGYFALTSGYFTGDKPGFIEKQWRPMPSFFGREAKQGTNNYGFADTVKGVSLIEVGLAVTNNMAIPMKQFPPNQGTYYNSSLVDCASISIKFVPDGTISESQYMYFEIKSYANMNGNNSQVREFMSFKAIERLYRRTEYFPAFSSMAISSDYSKTHNVIIIFQPGKKSRNNYGVFIKSVDGVAFESGVEFHISKDFMIYETSNDSQIVIPQSIEPNSNLQSM